MPTEALKSNIARLLRISGWVLSLLALAFFVRLVARQGMAVPGHQVPAVIGISVAGAVVYGVAVVLLGVLWPLLVREADVVTAASSRPLVASYLTSQFAKYLPGNVFQYAARHAFGRQLGISHGRLVGAAVVEASMLVGAAAFIVVVFGMPMGHDLYPGAQILWRPIGLLVPAVVIGLAAGPRPGPLRRLPRYPWGRMLVAFTGYATFFVVFGLLFWGLLAWVDPAEATAQRAVPAAALAWLVGFLVPGAPAGAGLREAALALAAGAGEPSQAVLAAIVIFRLATMGGDLLSFLIGAWLARAPTTG